MQRIPYPVLTPAQEEQHARAKINLSKIMFLLPPKILAGMSAAGKAMLFESPYDPLLRELIILRVGYLSNCEYEAHQHRVYGRQMGLSDAQVEAAMAPTLGAPLTQREQDVLRFTEEVVVNVRPSDVALAGARRHLSDSEILETLFIISNYMFIARVIETSGIPLDAPGVIVSNPDK
ncbi:MAG: carboxymuconolactone decarboxylase family protein [Spongiibacteraceae bacterium]